MTLKEALFGDSEERAVSPVIGVILMVAITVILAAVIGTFVLNLSKQTGNVAPQATFSFQDADDAFTDNHARNDTYFRVKQTGGSDLSVGDIKVIIRDTDTSAILAQFNETNGYSFNSSGGSTPALNLTYNSYNTLLGTSNTLGTGDSLFVSENTGAGFAHTTGFSANEEYSIELVHEPTGKTIDQGTVTLR